jgi:hypothetical protein
MDGFVLRSTPRFVTPRFVQFVLYLYIFIYIYIHIQPQGYIEHAHGAYSAHTSRPKQQQQPTTASRQFALFLVHGAWPKPATSREISLAGKRAFWWFWVV